MRYLKIVYLDLAFGEIGRIPTVDEFNSVFESLDVSDDDFTSGNFTAGAGGEADFFKLLTKQVTIQQLKNG